MIANCKIALQLKGIDLAKSENINTGFVASELISSLKKREVIESADIAKFKKNI